MLFGKRRRRRELEAHAGRAMHKLNAEVRAKADQVERKALPEAVDRILIAFDRRRVEGWAALGVAPEEIAKSTGLSLRFVLDTLELTGPPPGRGGQLMPRK